LIQLLAHKGGCKLNMLARKTANERARFFISFLI
jgi:hypothetical protein